MQIIPIRMIMQVESPDDYISRVRRGVAEQIRQDSIIRKKFWMDGLKTIVAMLLIFALGVLVLIGLTIATEDTLDIFARLCWVLVTPITGVIATYGLYGILREVGR